MFHFAYFKMHSPNCFLVSILLMIADGFTVHGPAAPLSAPLGSSVVLPCYVDEALPLEDLEVEWRRADSETLVHLYQDGESRPEVQQQDYHDRAHFFTEEIQHGNFSLRLDNLTAQDEGEYRCKVFIQQDSGETGAQIKDVERLLVSGSDESISAYAGEDVTLICTVDSHITPEHIEEVSWRKTNKDGDILVLLYQNNETLAESSVEQFRGRVEFFTAEIPKGNFSLRLKSVRTEDKGVYMCQVFAGHLSANVTVELGRLGFSALHIMVFILCIAASGSALLFCIVIYCRSVKEFRTCHSLYARCGSSVVLPCYVDKPLPLKGLKVEWRRADPETLVHLYQDGESRPEKQQQDYHDRAHFFTESIKHGNFSLRLENVRVEDAGEYRCEVYSKRRTLFSTTVEVFAGFFVKDSKKFAPLGSSVVLPNNVDKALPMERLKVEWRRADSETLVHLYQDGESRPEVQQQDYHDRAHFFIEKIQHGNVSLRLDNLTAQDAGEYKCTVYSEQDSVVLTSTLLLDLTLHATSSALVAVRGSSVVLPCYVEKSLLKKGLKVEWKRFSGKDSETLIHLYQDGESRPEVQQQDYHDRAHFFTEEIQHGNVSLRLDNLTAEDKGKYKCRVYEGDSFEPLLSTETKLAFKLDPATKKLGYLHVFTSNIMMFVAFVLWGVTEGFLFETVYCCALYILRPLMLIYVAPYLKMTDAVYAEVIAFVLVHSSVLISVAWKNIVNYADVDSIIIMVIIGFMILSFVSVILYFIIDELNMPCQGKICEWIEDKMILFLGLMFFALPSFQTTLMLITFRAASGGVLFTTFFPLLLFVIFFCLIDITREKSCSNLLTVSSWMIFMTFTNTGIIYFFFISLKHEKDGPGWTCTALFVQLLWMIIMLLIFKEDSAIPLIFKKILYMFGSVGVVLLNSIAIMTELVLKTINGEGAVGDLRIVVFSSESVFVLFLIIVLAFEPWISDIRCVQCCQNAAPGSDETPASGLNPNTGELSELHEVNLLNTEDQDTADEPRRKCVVLNDYTPVEDDKLELVKGETIEILIKDGELWKGKKNNQIGFFPSNYVKEIDDPSEVTGSNHSLDSQNAAGSEETPARSNQKQKTTESAELIEMSALLKPEDQEAGMSDMTEDNPLYSVEAQT